MSSTDYNYDGDGQFFPYFILTMTSLITIPVTYSLLKPSKELENTATRIQSSFKPEHADLIDGQRRKQKRRERRLKRGIVSIGGWVVITWMIYLMIVTARTIPKIWDPYDVLGVSRSASEKEIKRHYRNLGKTQHPDKVQEDPARNITKDSINDHWVEVTKAFKALTDEDIRNNFLQYGHPDGKQSFSIGIALPKWIVTEGHGKYVLLVYALLLGVLLPYFVGKWWYGTQRVTRDKVLVASAGHLFREYKPEMGDGAVIGALSSGEEFNVILAGNKADHGASRVEQKILEEGEVTPIKAGLDEKDRRMLQDQEGVRRKVLSLLWAYLGRIELEDLTLNDEKFEIAPVALQLNEAFVTISLAYGITNPVLSAYHAIQNLIQAIPPSASPLLQLPYFTPEVARAVEGEASRKHMSIQDYMHLSADQRKKRTVGAGLLSGDQYKDAITTASQLPFLQVEKTFFKVVGERYVTPGSLVQFVVKARIIPPGSVNVPPVKEEDLEDVDAPEGDVAAITGRKDDKSGEKPIQPPLAHAPYFARDRSPRWHVFLADSKQGKIAVPPFTFSTFDKPLLDDSGKPTFNVQTFKMQFGAPPQAGRYTFVMHLICDSYVGMDTKMEVTLVVEEASKAEEMGEDDEISEPDEDTVAGQLQSLKSGSLPGATKPKKRYDESSDGSDTEGDVDTESETDTDTDTDDE